MCTAKKNGTRQHDMLHSFNWCQINWILPRSPATATIAARTEQLASGRALADDDCPPGGVLAGGCALWLRLWLTVALWLVGWPTDWPTDSLSVRQHLLSESTSIDCVYVACAYEYLHCLPLAQYNAFASFNCSLLLLWHLLPTFFFFGPFKMQRCRFKVCFKLYNFNSVLPQLFAIYCMRQQRGFSFAQFNK